MPLSALALVVLAGLIHASWNIAAKKANGGAQFAFFIGVCTVLVWAPVGVVLAVQHLSSWSMTAWGCVAASGLIHVAYFVVLLRGYRQADLTVVYPIARGSGPLISSAVAIGVMGEQLSGWGAVGIAAVVLGVLLIAGGPGLLWKARDVQLRARLRQGAQYGLLTGLTIACYTLVDGFSVKTLLLSPMLMYYMSCVVQTFLLWPSCWNAQGASRQRWLEQWKYALLVGVFSPISYVLVLYALQMAPLSHVAPAREVSMLFAALIGGYWLGEGNWVLRGAGAASIGLGVLALSVG